MTTTSTEQRTCAKHGAYEARNLYRGSVWSRCPACDAEVEERQRQRDEERRQREREELKRSLVAYCGATGRFLETSFDNYAAETTEQRAVKAACRSFAEGFRRDQGGGLILIGPVGTGKTHLVSAIALDVIHRHAASARIVTARALVREMRDAWRKDSERSEADVIQEYGTVSLLVLDEAGVGFGTDHERTQLLDVIDARYQRKLPTVIASNLTVKELREALGDRAFDRICEGAKVLILNWKSHRAGGAA